jgi:hypothetical protein
MVTAATRNIAAILVSFGGAEGLESSCQRMTTLLQKYGQGQEIQFRVCW